MGPSSGMTTGLSLAPTGFLPMFWTARSSWRSDRVMTRPMSSDISRMMAAHISRRGTRASSWLRGSCGMRTKKAAEVPSSSSTWATTEKVAGSMK